MTNTLCATSSADFFSATTVAGPLAVDTKATLRRVLTQWMASAIAVFHEKTEEPLAEAAEPAPPPTPVPVEGAPNPGGEGATVGFKKVKK